MKDIFDFEKKTSRYAVMGNPINHSKSPLIHQQFAKQTSQDLSYEAIHVDLGGFTQAVRNFQANDGQGLNITVPFKLDAFRIADTLTQRAEQAGAVNTLKFEDDGSITGDNTDGQGLVDDLILNHDCQIKDKRILILGAGGAARGVLAPIKHHLPAEVFIANRTPSKAKALADDFHLTAGGGFADMTQAFDIVINATSASLQAEVPPVPVSCVNANSFCYDMMYAAQPTPFMLWAEKQGVAKVSDGLGMLVGQAAESFLIWRGIKPEVAPVIDLIRQQLKKSS